VKSKHKRINSRAFYKLLLMQVPPLPTQPSALMPGALGAGNAQFMQMEQPPFTAQPLAQSRPDMPFGPPPPPQQPFFAAMQPPQPTTMQPQALAGQWQQMSPLFQPDNLAVKYDGKVRTAMHSQFLMALADQILSVTDWNSLLSALNGHRMQGVRVLQQPIGPVAIQKQDVKFNGEEAMILSQLVQSGTFDRLKETPILAMYEYFLTIDDYCMKCAELSEKCVRHLLAVRRQATAPTTVTVETSEDGKLLPQRMSDEDIQRHKEQVPPPDFIMWGIRDLMPRHGKRRFDNAQDTEDKLTGLEGLMSTQFDCGLTWVSNMSTYTGNPDKMNASGTIDNNWLGSMAYEDSKFYRPKASLNSHIIGKTPYQRCVDEAVLLSHSFYNDYVAICEGLFRVHFLTNARKLSAPDTSDFTVNSLIQRGHVIFADETKPGWSRDALMRQALPNEDDFSKKVLAVLPDTITNFNSTFLTGKPQLSAENINLNYKTATALEQASPFADAFVPKGDWINCCANSIVSGSPAGSGLLQPKPVPWREYGDNYIRKVVEIWTGQPIHDPSWKRTSYIQTLPIFGGAIGEYFAAYVAPVTIAENMASQNSEAIENAKQDAAQAMQSWGWWLWNKTPLQKILDAKPNKVDASLAAAPYPFLCKPDKDATNDPLYFGRDLGIIMAHFKKTKVDFPANAPSLRKYARTQARRTSREQLWERAKTLAPHPIMHMGTLGAACAKVHFDSWLKRNYLFPLMRIFNEVCTDYADTELNCPPSTEVYPVIAKDGNLYAAPASQVGVTDPTTGRVTFPSASAAASRCVLPGATPPPPVPGFARQMGEERAVAPQVKVYAP
jgi:hypothetical protein